MNKHLTSLLLSLGFLCTQYSHAQQFGEDTDEFLLKIMYGDMKSADLDGDGDEDLIISGQAGLNGNGHTYIYFNDWYYGFSLHQSIGLPNIMFSSIATGDIDHDGDIDLFFSGSDSFSYYTGIYKNDGAGNFTEDNSSAFTAVCLGSSIFFDANGDGHQDLFYFGRNATFSGVSRLYLNDGNGQFTNTPVSIEAFQSGSVAAADYDKDGDLDLLISGETNMTPVADRTKLYNNDGDGGFTEVQYPFAAVFQGSAVFSDIDNDDDVDIIVNGRTNGINTYHSQFHINDGIGNYTYVGNRGLDSLGGCSLSLADIDMDGDEDIFLTGRSKAGADSCALYYNENGFFTKDSTHYSQGLTQGGAIFMNVDDNCSPDLVYFGFGDLCLTQTYCFLNNNQTSCPEEEEEEEGPNPIYPIIEEVTYKVFSNPFRDYLHVEVSEKVLKAMLYDLSGHLIYEYLPDSETINIQLEDLANGIYYLRFITVSEPRGTSIKLSKID